MGVCTGPPNLEILDRLAADLCPVVGVSCHVSEEWIDAHFAFDARRNQYYSTAILRRLAEQADGSCRILGVTPLDLFVPILTFVFGEAQLMGDCAVVSTYRLNESVYGLESDPDLIALRLTKEALHELGHTHGLRHCHRWDCVMASAHSVERLDAKEAGFCDQCKAAMRRL